METCYDQETSAVHNNFLAKFTSKSSMSPSVQTTLSAPLDNNEDRNNNTTSNTTSQAASAATSPVTLSPPSLMTGEETPTLHLVLLPDFSFSDKSGSAYQIQLLIIMEETPDTNIFKSSQLLASQGAHYLTVNPSTSKTELQQFLPNADLILFARQHDNENTLLITPLVAKPLVFCISSDSVDSQTIPFADALSDIDSLSELKSGLINLVNSLIDSTVVDRVKVDEKSVSTCTSSIHPHICLVCRRRFTTSIDFLSHCSANHSFPDRLMVNDLIDTDIVLISMPNQTVYSATETCIYGLYSISSFLVAPSPTPSSHPRIPPSSVDDAMETRSAFSDRPLSNQNSMSDRQSVNEDVSATSSLPFPHSGFQTTSTSGHSFGQSQPGLSHLSMTSLPGTPGSLSGIPSTCGPSIPAAPLGMPLFSQAHMNFLLSLAAHAQAQRQSTNANDKSLFLPMGFDGGLPTQAHLPTGPASSHCARNSNKTIKCPHCNWHYKYQETLDIHLRDKHPDHQFTTNGSSSGSGDTLGNGGSSGGGSASQCFYCLNKQQHPRLSRGETYSCGYKPYRCEVCNYSTTTKGNLSIHIQSDKHINNMHEHNQNLEMNRFAASTGVVNNVPTSSQGVSTANTSGHDMSSLSNRGAVIKLPDPLVGFKTEQQQHPSAHNMPSVSHTAPSNTADSFSHDSTSLLNGTSHQQQIMSLVTGQWSQNAISQIGSIPTSKTPSGTNPTLLDLSMPTGVPATPKLTRSGFMVPSRSSDRIFLCQVCMQFETNNLDEMQTHITMQRSTPGSSTAQDDTMVYHEGYWHCRLCSYKSNLKANFQLHCKTDKHLQRQQLLAHVREGGPGNEVRFSSMSTASPVQVRCQCCQFFTTSVHKLRIHAAQSKHEVTAALFHSLADSERALMARGHIFPTPLMAECRLCGVVAPSKTELMLHLQTDQHERAYSTLQFQCQSQKHQLDLSTIVSLVLPEMARSNPSQGSLECSTDKKPSSPDDSTQDPSTSNRDNSSKVNQCPLCKEMLAEEGDLALRQHLEKEHKIVPEFVEKFIQIANMYSPIAANNNPVQAPSSEDLESVKDNSQFRVTSDPDDMSADAFLMLEKCKSGNDEDRLRCHACAQIFTGMDEFEKHQEETGHGEELLGSSGYLCFKKGCNQYFQSLDYLKLHFREIHAKAFITTNAAVPPSNFPHLCSVCHLLAFSTEENLSAHRDLHTAKSSSVESCLYCSTLDASEEGKEGTSNENCLVHGSESWLRLRQHLVKDHSEHKDQKLDGSVGPKPGEVKSDGGNEGRKFQCQVCQSEFGKQAQLSAHMRVHVKKRSPTETPSDLDDDSTSDKFHCDVCQESFTSRQNLATHNNSLQHTYRLRAVQASGADTAKLASVPYKCNVCNVGFQQKAEFEAHCMSVEHLTYMANISRLVQEGRMQQNKMLLETPLSIPASISPLDPSPQPAVPTSYSSAPNLSSYPALSMHQSLTALPPSSLNSFTHSLAMQQQHQVAQQMMMPSFPGLFPGSVNPALFPQLFTNMFYRFPFQSTPPIGMLGGNTMPPTMMGASPNMRFNCPTCNESISGLEACKEHKCFAMNNTITSLNYTKGDTSANEDDTHEDMEDEDEEDDDIQKPLQIVTDTASNESLPESAESAENNKSSDPSTSQPPASSTSDLSMVSSPQLKQQQNILPPAGFNMSMMSSGSYFSSPFNLLNMSTSGQLPNVSPYLSTSSSSTNLVSTTTSASHFTPPPPLSSGLQASPQSTYGMSSLSDGQKRGRTRITEDQLRILRSYFDLSNSPSDAKIQEMIQLTGLDSRVIKHWFRNTLFKERQRNKNSPYNFSVPPSTSLNLEEYEKTGRVEVKSESELDRPADLRDQEGDKRHDESLMPLDHDETHDEEDANQVSTEIFLSQSSEEQKSMDSSDMNKNLKNDACCTVPAPVSIPRYPMSMDTEYISGPASPTSSSVSFSDTGTSEGEQLSGGTQGQNHHLPGSSQHPFTSSNASSIISISDAHPTEINGIKSSIASGQQSDDHNPGNVVKTSLKRRQRPDTDEEESPSNKRIRTTITPEQQDVLLGFYQKDPNPSRKQMDVISSRVDLSKRVVQVWFQNTRSRDRKGLLRTPPSGLSVTPVTTPAPPPLPSPGPLQNLGSSASSQRCIYCGILFKVRNALEVHVAQCHPDKLFNSSTSSNGFDMTNTVSEAINMHHPTLMSSIPIFDTKSMTQPSWSLPKDEVDEMPLDLSRPSNNPQLPLSYTVPTASSTAGRSDELDDSHTIYWDDDSSQDQNQQSLQGLVNPNITISGSNMSKRNRTSISNAQIRTMKSILVHYKTPSNHECDMLGSCIGLTRRVVQVWFQNQRAKEKKHIRETVVGSGDSYGCYSKKHNSVRGYLTSGDGTSNGIPSWCELCEGSIRGSGGENDTGVQEHLFSYGHLERLMRRIMSEEAGDVATQDHKSESDQTDTGKPMGFPSNMNYSHFGGMSWQGITQLPTNMKIETK